MLGPATFDQPSQSSTNLGIPSTHEPRSPSHSRSNTPRPNIIDENTSDEDDIHFTLKKSIDPSKYTHLLRLRPKLTSTNYSIWMSTVYRALETVGLHIYVHQEFEQPKHNLLDQRHHPVRWAKANLFVCSVLISCMTEEVMSQLAHLQRASEIWMDARRLYSGTTATDWTLVMTSLVTTRYQDGEDINEHIAKMKGFRRDLILMRRDIEDELFACFLRISMPATWNYVFAALPDHYTSIEVERRIRDEFGIRASQSSTASTSYEVSRGNKSRSGLSRTPIPGQPFCENCNISGHWTKDCYSKGGAKQGQGPQRNRQKSKRDNKGDEKDDKSRKGKYRSKSGKKANQAVADEDDVSDTDEDHSDTEHSSYITSPPSRSRFGWILDGGSTTHICTERAAFATFTPLEEHIQGIVKNGPALQVLGYGSVLVNVSVKGRADRIVKLTNVRYCPNARDNLMSESRMDRKGMEITKRNGRLTIKKPNGEIVMEGKLINNLYEIKSVIAPPTARHEVAFSARSGSNLDLWHARFAHISLDNLRYLARHNLVTGMDLRGNGDLVPCNGCAKGKHPQAPFPSTATRAKKTLDRIHMDLQGPLDKSRASTLESSAASFTLPRRHTRIPPRSW